MSNWSDLPEDILILIVKRIRILSDYIRFSGVCFSWRSVALKDRYHHPRLQLPGLMVPIFNQRRGFLPVLQTKLYHNREQDHHLLPPLILPEEVHYICRGCNQGWLLMVSPLCMAAHLLNPITGVQIPFPPLSASMWSVSKVVLSSNPSYSSTAIYAFVLFNEGAMSFFQLGDTVFTPIIPNSHYEPSGYKDAIFFKGKLYVEHDTGEFFVCDLTTSPVRMIKEVNIPKGYEANTYTQYFLVELGGELLHVARVIPCNSPPIFRILKLDCSGNSWVVVESLGEYALFLGYIQAFSLSEMEVRGIKGNHIYFYNYLDDTGIFNLENSKTEPLFPNKIGGMLADKLPTFWVNPIPW